MKILIFNEDETLEEFEKITDAIIHGLVDLRGMPTDNGQYMRTGIEELHREDTTIEIVLAVHRVECRRLDDF